MFLVDMYSTISCHIHKYMLFNFMTAPIPERTLNIIPVTTTNIPFTTTNIIIFLAG